MYKLNDKISALTPYEPLKGEFKVRLDANESYIDLDKGIVAEITEEIKKINFNRYPDTLAEKSCRAFADFYEIDSKNVTAGNGSDELISVIIGGFFKKGQKIVTTSPDFTMYTFYCHIFEVETVVLNKNSGLNLTATQIIESVKSSGAKGIILSNPCNPVSKGIDKEDMFKIAESLPDTLVIVDEAYMDFDDNSILKKATAFSNVIVLKTCSKAFGLAAIRLGFAVANTVITNALRAIKSPYNINTLTNVAASVVLSHKQYLCDCIKKIIAQRIKLYNMLIKFEGIEVYESRTNFIFVKTAKAKEIFYSLLNKKIAIRNLGEYLRITAGSDEENSLFIKAFSEVI